MTNENKTGLEIITTRTFNVPRELAYRAWTEPDHRKNWLGPAGFTNTFFAFDLRFGGRWRFFMHVPEKENYQNECEFIAIEKPSLMETPFQTPVPGAC